MDKIIYNGINYPTRTFDAHLADEDENGIQTITIASSELSEALGDRIEVTDSEEEGIDSQIYFYVEAECFDLESDVICRLHLDEEFIFVTEYK
jgi:hypothetical protein